MHENTFFFQKKFGVLNMYLIVNWKGRWNLQIYKQSTQTNIHKRNAWMQAQSKLNG
jgi:hypothetical protein